MNIENLVRISDSFDNLPDGVVEVNDVSEEVENQASDLILDYCGYEGLDEVDALMQFYDDRAGDIAYFKSSSKEKLDTIKTFPMESGRKIIEDNGMWYLAVLIVL